MRRRTARPILVVLLVMGRVCSFSWGAAFIRGDANSDGDLDLGDVITVLQHLFSNELLLCEAAADANDDGTIDIADTIYSLSFLFLDAPAPPAPYPLCGLDSTPSPLGCEVFPFCPATHDPAFSAAPLSGPAPLDVLFDASESEGVFVAFEWDFGDGARATGVIVRHTYRSEGVYRAVLRARAQDGLITEHDGLIEVHEPPGPGIRELCWTLDAGFVTLTWKNVPPVDAIRVFRGETDIGRLPGTDTFFTWEEENLGVFEYTVAAYRGGALIDQESTIVNRGGLAWDAPEDPVWGYYVFAADGLEQLPQWPSASRAFDASVRTAVSFKELFEGGLLEESGEYTFAAASYIQHLTSEFSNTVSAFCEIAVGRP